jgi:hypothetical protein
MTNRERMMNVLNFKPVDRMPAIELMPWWDKTAARWTQDGIPKGTNLVKHWNLDVHHQVWIRSEEPDLYSHRKGDRHDRDVFYIENEADYDKILPDLYPEEAVIGNWAEDWLNDVKDAYAAGDEVVWMTILGYFWWPRVLFGIQPHLLSFYEHPDLYHRICHDNMEYHLRVIDEFCSICKPAFMTFAEDMSYNNGPMLSKAMFDEFIKPYYLKVIPVLQSHGTKVFVDTDGDPTMMIPWLLECGVDGLSPNERQSGVDVNWMRKEYPDFLMLGGYNKTIMKLGEAAMREEFERIIPAMESGGFIPSVDHQTPPDVSVENYAIYRKLQDEFCAKYHP